MNYNKNNKANAVICLLFMANNFYNQPLALPLSQSPPSLINPKPQLGLWSCSTFSCMPVMPFCIYPVCLALVNTLMVLIFYLFLKLMTSGFSLHPGFSNKVCLNVQLNTIT